MLGKLCTDFGDFRIFDITVFKIESDELSCFEVSRSCSDSFDTEVVSLYFEKRVDSPDVIDVKRWQRIVVTEGIHAFSHLRKKAQSLLPRRAGKRFFQETAAFGGLCEGSDYIPDAVEF